MPRPHLIVAALALVLAPELALARRRRIRC